jgi:hypothetical protein
VPPFVILRLDRRIRCSSHQRWIEIIPFRIGLFDQFDLPGPIPMLEPLLAMDGVGDALELLDLYEQLQGVPLGEAGDQTLTVFPRAAANVVGDADVRESCGGDLS